MQQYFTNKILAWHEQNDRPLPWKGEQDPYLIWLSEIILQQTRVSQGLPYFQRFKQRFPNVKSLALADEDEVLKLWQGLGYYSRARNLHAAAKYIHKDLGGKFPIDYDGIRKLKGVGEYTAAAIASFAFDLPYAVVDGNVYRVLSRFFGIKTPIDSTKGKKQFKVLANKLMPEDKPAAFNQAMMDFGATQCVPKSPDCSVCPLKSKCVAFKKDLVQLLPVKEKKITKRHRYFHYLIIRENDAIYLSKRSGKDIWRNLYEFPLIESDRVLTKEELKDTELWEQWFSREKPSEVKFSGSYQQTLTHQKIYAAFFETKSEKQLKNDTEFIRVKQDILDNFAFPRVIDLFLKDKTLYLNF